MEIILLQDVKALGKKDQVVKVNDGYARNYIIPKKLGIEATRANLNSLKLQKANEERIAKQQLEDAKALADQLKGKSVEVRIRSGEGGRTFGSVSSKEISAAAKQQLGLELDKRKIQVEEPIRALGAYIVSIKLHKDVTGQLTVKVLEQ